MANMSNNTVVFGGNPAATERAKTLFKEIQAKQEETEKWHLPLFVTAPFSNMQEILVNEGAIKYQTRWHPNFNDLIKIADHFELDFTMTCGHISDCIFGEASYNNKIFNDIRDDRLSHDQQSGLSR